MLGLCPVCVSSRAAAQAAAKGPLAKARSAVIAASEASTTALQENKHEIEAKQKTITAQEEELAEKKKLLEAASSQGEESKARQAARALWSINQP